MHIGRRDLLKAALAGGALAASPFVARRAFGAAPTWNILHLYLVGGLSHRHSLWVTPAQAGNHPYGSTTLGPTLADPIGQDDDGHDVAVAPDLYDFLSQTPDLADRFRLVALGHDVPEHTVAGHIAFTGRTMARRFQAASLGAAINAGLGNVSTPLSWVIDGGGAAGSTSTGELGGWTMPIGLSGREVLFGLGLSATTPQASDDLVCDLTADYGKSLGLAQGTSLGFTRFEAALRFWRDVRPTLTPASTYGGWPTSQKWPTTLPLQLDTSLRIGKALSVAGALFDNGARYVSFVDPGLSSTGGGLDSHDRDNTELWKTHSSTVLLLLSQLAAAVRTGEIDLDTTLVVIQSEFGRHNAAGMQSNHCSAGYAVAAIGGPVHRGVRGVITDTVSGNNCPNRAWRAGGTPPWTPTDLYAALGWAAGIDVVSGSSALGGAPAPTIEPADLVLGTLPNAAELTFQTLFV